LKYKIWFMSESICELNFDLEADLNINLRIGLNPNNYVSLKLDSVSVDHKFNQLNIEGPFLLHIFSKHINWFKSVINWSLKSTLNSQLNSILSTVDLNLQKNITLPFLNASVALMMSNNIQYNSDNFELGLLLDITDLEQKEGLRFLYNTNKKISSVYNEAIQFSMDSILINKLIQILLKNDRSIVITNDSLPKDLPFKINTLYFSSLIPAMFQKYPNEDLAITLSLDSFPMVNFNSTYDTVNLDLNLAMTFSLKNKPDEQIFTLSTGITVELLLDGSKEDSTLHLQIKEVAINDVFVIQNEIEISADSIKKNFNTFVSSLIYFANNYLRINPIPIPVIQGMKFESINISIGEENLLVIRCKPDFTTTEFNWIQ
jgi:hypothetical protein